MRALYPHPAARGVRYTDNAWGGLYIVSGRLAMPQVGIWQNIVPRFCCIPPKLLLPGTLSRVSFTLMRTIRCLILSALFSVAGAMNCAAIEITRYVSPDGTGNGLSADTPTSDLGAVLKSSVQVDHLTVYAAPGYYHISPNDVAYSNVTFYGGCPNDSIDTHRLTVIDGYYGGFSNSGIYQVKFNKNLGLAGNCIAELCTIYGRVGIGARNSGDKIIMEHCEMNEIWAEGQERTLLYLHNCNVDGSKGYGLEAKNIRVVATKVKFNNHKIAGVNLDTGIAGIGSEFNYCTFNNNKREGGVITRAITDNIAVTFRNCEFIGNSSEQYNKASALSAFCPIEAYNCVFKDNTTALKSHPGEYHESAVVDLSPRSHFRNCTFVDNKNSAFSYQVYPGDVDPGYAQLESCLLLDNGKDIRTPHGAAPRMVKCAISNGT
ncbi:MAG: right-handed parallel beta-helix repeat-containing protein, partial [Muribaculaceae bacterium]|nr:right-handed parallel beta-helix repeat-containing protein [Muribaculaceae bacterium]